MSCRLPGASGVEEFWDLLTEGRDAVARQPDGSWRAALAETGTFDAGFFGMSPRQAAAADPQQRLVLELGWEALEHAGVVPATLAGSRTGVFVGVTADDYATSLWRTGTTPDGYTVPGLNRSMIANRLSYLLELRGPSFVVDSAQSSSLVAVHLACESLLRGESDAAIVAGVSLISTPESTAAMASLGALSPDGRCYTFDARANGYVRGEGGAAVVLKRLSDALVDGDRVHAVILGGAVNNDGGGPGLLAPDRAAQEEVLRRAYDRSGVGPAQVTYVELHGTGTPVGDPVEAAALGAVFGADRRADDPLHVGSVKSNIGHLEGAAGITGLLKAVLCVREGVLPPTLNHQTPNPGIPLAQLRLRVQTTVQRWPDRADEGRRIAAVSSFGMGGTNAHLVLAQAPERAVRPAVSPTTELPAVPWVLSARSEAALRGQAERLREHLDRHPDLRPLDVGFSLATSRDVFPHRSVRFADGEPVAAGSGRLAEGRVAWVFPGQGAQWTGMAAASLTESPVFAARLTECAAAVTPFVDWSLLDVLRAVPGSPRLDRDDVVQPACFAVMVSLAELWRSWGVVPEAVVGHSQGEIAAAVVAGAISLEDGARIVALRSQLLTRELHGLGGMVSVGLPVAETERLLTRWSGRLHLAVVNGPNATVVAGDGDALDELVTECERRQARVRRVAVEYASHSPHVERIRDELMTALRPVTPQPSAVAFYSTADVGITDGERLDAGYWYRNLRQPVRFADTLRQMSTDGYTSFVELSAHPMLVTALEEILAQETTAALCVTGSLRRDEGGLGRMLASAAEGWAHGLPVDWRKVFAGTGAERVELPTYAFQRQRYWAPDAERTAVPPAAVDAPVRPAASPPEQATPAQATTQQTYDLLRTVLETVATVQGLPSAETVDPDLTFKEQGLESYAAVEFRNRLRARVGLSLPATLVYDFPTPTAVAGFLGDQLHPRESQLVTVTPALVDDEPIAIVGMGCRFPGGVSSPEDLWDVVASGVDAVSPFPVDRGWDLESLFDGDPDRAGTTYCREGGFLDDAAGFDAGFFGVSPREAVAMDPQQRLLLEGVVEGVGAGGFSSAGVRGSRTGVYAGVMNQEYGPRLYESAEEHRGYLLTGTAASVVSGRVSYVLGLEGPAVTVDTACSSSLVALHLAVQALRSGECDVALAGGVTVMATPGIFVEFSRQGGLAVDGRCKAYSDSADGTGWSEGVGVVVVQRLSDAVAAGRRVLAVVRGSAVNQDGASNGLTAPSGSSQQRVIRAALASARLSVGDVDVVEGHGTGTRLDPIEAQALLATYGRRGGGRSLLLGSVKSNIGHAQAAAGVAGVVKMVLAMERGVVPASLHVRCAVFACQDWSSGAVEVVGEACAWPETGRPRRAAVSSFGVSGTNAHVILEQAPPVVPDASSSAGAPVSAVSDADSSSVSVPWVLSARSEWGLRASAGRLEAALSGPLSGSGSGSGVVSGVDVGWSLGGRSVFGWRGVSLSGVGRLGVLAGGGVGSGVVVGSGRVASGGVVFVFPGQGAQWVGMARGLLGESGVFSEAFDEVGGVVQGLVDWPVRGTACREVGRGDLGRVDVVQPLSFVVMVALARLSRSSGVVPPGWVGHSQGEIAAAVVSGALSVEEGARVVVGRSRVIGARLAGGGAMVWVGASVGVVEGLLGGLGGGLEVAVVNGPGQVVVAGDGGWGGGVVGAGVGGWGVRARLLPVGYGSHCGLVDVVRDELLGVLGEVRGGSSVIPFYSSVDVGVVDGGVLDGGYWFRNLRLRVRFGEVVRRLVGDGFSSFVEVSAHPVLVGAIEDVLGEVGGGVGFVCGGFVAVGVDGGLGRMVVSAAEGWVRGLPVQWRRVPVLAGGRQVGLPTYPFQHDRYWLAPAPRTAVAAGATAADGAAAGVGWRYRVGWKALPVPTPGRLHGRWLVVHGHATGGVDQLSGVVADILTRHGATTEHLTIDPAEPGVLAERLGALAAAGEPVRGVVSLLDLDGTLLLVQAMGRAGLDARIRAVTTGAVAVSSDEVPSSEGAALWAFGRVAALELPDRWAGLIDLPVQADARALERLAGALTSEEENQLAVRASGLYTRRIIRTAGRARKEWRPRGTVLVTGGTGALGARVARWLADHGAEHLVLVSRRGAQATGAAELVAGLERTGVRVTVAACDVADRDGAGRPAGGAPTAGGLPHRWRARRPDGGPAHSRGSGCGVPAERLAATHLHDLTAHRDLDAFVLFSSIVGSWGNAGQAAYAAANAALDALAEQRRSAGLPATSIAWGLWAGAGMADGAGEQTFTRRGVRAMDPDDGIAALRQALDSGDTCVTVADVDWPSMVRTHANPAAARLFEEIPEARQALADRAAEQSAERPSDLARRLTGLTAADRRRLLLDLIGAQAAVILRQDSGWTIPPDSAFRASGFDSLTALELRNRLNAATGLTLPSTVVFDHPSPVALADFLLDAVLPRSGGADGVVEVAAAPDEPIAVIGVGCRYPGGVATPEQLWDLLLTERDAIGPLPTDRGWNIDDIFDPEPGRVGRTYCREGGFLHDAADFDAAFFGISPREALAMDPQQRLILETSWEALERAGIDPRSLRGSRTGVYTGMTHQEYAARLHEMPEEYEGHLLTGTSGSVASGRVSYVLGLEGPAVTVDTACSSSLVAIHLAVQALRAGECDLALAGGVTVMATRDCSWSSPASGASPRRPVQGVLRQADGTGWSEGAGVITLARLSDAVRDGRHILALIRGPRSTRTVPATGSPRRTGRHSSASSRLALANAGLTPPEVDAVEAHGTGTRLGDPIEAGALLATYGQGRPVDQPVRLGTLKSNIGHTQAAAGVAGMIKMVLALRHGVLPATLHATEPSPHIDWNAGAVSLLTERTDWPDNPRPRRAAVSAFGISGTNAHIILEQAPEPTVPSERSERAAGPRLSVVPWPLSGRSEPALRAQAARLRDFLDDGADPVDVGFSLATTRSRLDHRAVVLLDGETAPTEALHALVSGDAGRAVLSGTPRDTALAFLFTGQGSQRLGMADGIRREFPPFAEALAEIAAEMDTRLDQPLLSVMFAEPGSATATLIDRTEYAQPALFAVEVALFRLFESWGVRPDVLLGHSVGEIAAAHVAGVMDLEHACRLVAARGRLMQRMPADGAMIAIRLPEERVREQLHDLGRHVSVAAVNGPESVVVSGAGHVVRSLADQLTAEGHRVRRLNVSHAFHSPHVDEVLEEFRKAAAEVRYGRPLVPVVSNVTGRVATEDELGSAEYWVRHLREPVRFHDGIRTLLDRGATTLVELGPDGVLCGLAAQCLDPDRDEVALVPALHRTSGEVRSLVAAAATVHVRGHDVDWNGFFAETGARRVDLPTYAFQRQRYWASVSPPGSDQTAAVRFGLNAADHPLLGGALSVAGSEDLIFTGRLSLAAQPWIAGHRVGERAAARYAFLEVASRAGRAVGGDRVRDLQIEAPLVVPDRGAVQVQVVLTGGDEPDGRQVRVFARPEGSTAPWTRHATGNGDAAGGSGRRPGVGALVAPEGAVPLDVGDLYRRFAAQHLEYDGVFTGVRELWRRADEVFAEVRLPDGAEVEAAAFGVHPALLDAALQPWLAGDFVSRPADSVHLPFAWQGMQVHTSGAAALRVRIRRAGESAVSMQAVAVDGAPVCSLDALVLRPTTVRSLRRTVGPALLPLHHLRWREREPGQAPGTPLTFLGPTGAERYVGEAVTVHQDLTALRAVGQRGAPPPRAVLAAFGSPHRTAEAVRAVAAAALDLVQRWLADDRHQDSRLVLVTERAVAADDHEDVPDLAGAAVWGLVRSAQSEHPGRFALIDHDGTEQSRALLPAAVALGCAQLALRQGTVRVPALAALPPTESGADTRLAPDGTVLVTGAAGALGALVVRHLVAEHGVRRLLLLSRHGREAAGMAELAEDLAQRGVTVTVLACDVADRTGLAAALDAVPDEHPLTAVVHAAGVLDDAMVTGLTADRLDEVLRPKVDAALHLHELTADRKLAAFVLFSAAAGLLGNPGQASYAAANTVLDALAHHRRANGLPATSLAWGVLGGPNGMAANLNAAHLRRLARYGIAPLDGDEARSLLDRALRTDRALLVPLRLTRVDARQDPADVPEILRPLVVPVVADGGGRSPATGPNSLEAFRAQLAELDDGTRGEHLLDLVRRQVAEVLGHDRADVVDPKRPFQDLGFDSLLAVELRNRLQAATGLPLPATLGFDHPTPQTVVDHLAESLLSRPEGDPGEQALTGLDAVARALTKLGDEDIRRVVVRRRLAELLATVAGAEPDLANGGGTGAGVDDGHDDTALVERLSGASDEDLLAFIDEQI
nr:polyketide synthase [Micromonospora griseorubida]